MATGSVTKSAWKLLWENPNPNQAFPSQTISLNLSGYEIVKIVFDPFQGENQSHSSECLVGMSGDLSFIQFLTSTASDAAHALNGTSRAYTVNTNGITFGSANMFYNGGAYQGWDSRSIPRKIYAM